MTQAPIDPFDLKPLRYRLEVRGFVVYSVGSTLKFDGAANDREAVFHYPGYQ